VPRTARSCSGGYTYHVLNRGDARAAAFHKPDGMRRSSTGRLRGLRLGFWFLDWRSGPIRQPFASHGDFGSIRGFHILGEILRRFRGLGWRRLNRWRRCRSITKAR
jgi:hypothetical protein